MGKIKTFSGLSRGNEVSIGGERIGLKNSAKLPVDLERRPGSENILVRSVDNLSLTEINFK
jgi:hypothetical protein